MYRVQGVAGQIAVYQCQEVAVSTARLLTQGTVRGVPRTVKVIFEERTIAVFESIWDVKTQRVEARSILNIGSGR